MKKLIRSFMMLSSILVLGKLLMLLHPLLMYTWSYASDWTGSITDQITAWVASVGLVVVASAAIGGLTCLLRVLYKWVFGGVYD